MFNLLEQLKKLSTLVADTGDLEARRLAELTGAKEPPQLAQAV